MIIEIGSWQVQSQKSEKHLEVLRAGLAVQRAKRDEWLYKESRYYTRSDDETAVEHWMYIDVYENLEDCQKQWKKFEEDPEAKAMLEKWQSVIVPDSFKSVHWTEKNELKVE